MARLIAPQQKTTVDLIIAISDSEVIFTSGNILSISIIDGPGLLVKTIDREIKIKGFEQSRHFLNCFPPLAEFAKAKGFRQFNEKNHSTVGEL